MLTAVEACKQLAKTIRDELNKTQKVKLSPKDAALKVTKEVVGQIKDFQKNLEKLDTLEKAHLSGVNLPSKDPLLETGNPKEALGQSVKGRMVRMLDAGHAPHDITGSPVIDHIVAHHKKIQAAASKIKPNLPKSEPPSDAPLSNTAPLSNEELRDQEMAKPQPTRSVFEVLGKTTIPEAVAAKDKVEPVNRTDKEESNKGAVLPDFKQPQKVDAPGSGGKKEKGDELSKALPFLGGKDQASKDMAGAASMAASKEAERNKKMPTRQQSMKLPSMKDQGARQDMFQAFTPKTVGYAPPKKMSLQMSLQKDFDMMDKFKGKKNLDKCGDMKVMKEEDKA